MTAIVLNTLTAAVAEYSGFHFHAITPTHAGAATGLFELGGDKDLDQAIAAEIRTAAKLHATTFKKGISAVYFSMSGAGQGQLSVFGRNDQWSYPFSIGESGESRAVPGRGIRENYLGFGFSNPDGDAFQIDCIEVVTHESKSRRI